MSFSFSLMTNYDAPKSRSKKAGHFAKIRANERWAQVSFDYKTVLRALANCSDFVERSKLNELLIIIQRKRTYMQQRPEFDLRLASKLLSELEKSA